MPELPEVEIIKQSLKKKIIYQRILGTTVRNRNLRFKLDKYFAKKINNKKDNSGSLSFEYKGIDQLDRLIKVIKNNY